MNYIAIGIGAGLASVLLTSVVTQGSGLAFILFLLAPIPVFIAALGWDHRSGLVATVVGGIALAILSGPFAGLAFALATALPAWWLAYLALLGRSTPSGEVEWYPLGRLLAWIAGTAALTYLAAAVVPQFDFAAYRETMREAGRAILHIQTGTPLDAPLPEVGGASAEDVIDALASAAPIFAAQGFTLVLVFYVWLSSKVVAISGRLARPWPSIAETVMPREALIALGGGAIVATLAGGFLGVFGLSLAGAFLMAFSLQGLAAIHEVTRGRGGRFLILFSLYLLVFVSQGLVLLALAMFGIADTALGIRARWRMRRPGPPGPPSIYRS